MGGGTNVKKLNSLLAVVMCYSGATAYVYLDAELSRVDYVDLEFISSSGTFEVEGGLSPKSKRVKG